MGNEQVPRGFAGEPILPDHPSYETARRVWNQAIDRRPALIGRCRDAADVAILVRHARDHGLALSVRGGGHGVAGHAIAEGGVVVDLSGLRAVTVDAATGEASADPGATWADLDGATAVHGLATPGGLVSTTGIAGLTLGGGIGWLMRRHGLACDNLIGAEVVDAEGRAGAADPDLLWGLRGGGGNFGVVTRFRYRLHPVTSVHGGQMIFPLERAAGMIGAFRALCDAAPDELTAVLAFLTAPPAPFVPDGLRGRKAVAIVACHLGDPGAAFGSLRALGPAVDLVGPLPYLTLQHMLDPGAPAGMHHHWKAEHLAALDEHAEAALLDAAADMPPGPAQIHVHQLGGAVARVPDGATAHGHRDAAFACNVLGTWVDPGAAEVTVAWARGTAARLQAVGTGGAYVNFLGWDDRGRASAAYGPQTLARLVALKRRVDPDNVFRGNVNIAP